MHYKAVKATVLGIITRTEPNNIFILLTKRNIEPFKNYWCFPGGHIDAGEKARDAVIREVQEETGLAFDPEFTGYNDEIFPNLDFYAAVLIFKGEASGRVTIQKNEVQDYRWVTVAEALSMKMAFNHHIILKQVFF